MTVDSMVNMILRKWNLSGADSALTQDVALQHLGDAIIEVENIDHNTNAIYTITDTSITFSEEPSDDVSLLYVYCALKNIQKAYLRSKINEGSIGMNIRSGMESVSTVEAGRLYSQIKEDFEKTYYTLLAKVKAKNNNTGTLLNIYDE